MNPFKIHPPITLIKNVIYETAHLIPLPLPIGTFAVNFITVHTDAKNMRSTVNDYISNSLRIDNAPM